MTNQEHINKEETIQQDFPFTPISELMAKEFPEPEWLVENLIPSASLVALSGSPASYKTWLILDMAIKIASGQKLFDHFATSAVPVLIVDEEGDERLLQKRLKELGADPQLPIFISSNGGFKLSEASTKTLITQCGEYGVKFVIFDSLVRIHTKDENEASGMARVADLIKKFNAKGIGVLFTHHNRKPGLNVSGNLGNEMRGSSDILASVDCHLANIRGEDTLVITQTKLRQQQELQPFRVGIISEEGSFRFEYQGEMEEKASKVKIVQQVILDFVAKVPPNTPLFKLDLFKRLRELKLIDCGHTTFKHAVDMLIEKGQLIATKGQKNQILISLPDSSNG